MNNLFILHTQYNLIIGSGIALEHKYDNNVLVLYSEFKINDSLLNNLKKVFSKVIVLRDDFEKLKTGFEEIKEIRMCLKRTKEIFKYKFDRIFISQERRLDTLIAYKIWRRNSCIISNIEEDVYYSLNLQPKTKRRKSVKSRLAEIIRLFLCGRNPFFDSDIPCYGANDMYDSIYAVYPKIVRPEITAKTIYEVTPNMLFNGINSLYCDRKCEYPPGEKYLVVFLDLVERYKNKELSLTRIKSIIAEKKQENYSVLIKYHPRETEKITEFEDVIEIDQLIPGEKVLSDLSNKDVLVLGNATTVCIIAAKFGYDVHSIARIDHESNVKMHMAMKSMGITLI